MSAADENFAEVDRDYRRARWTMIGHAVFLLVCCVLVAVLRRLFGLPPAVLGTVIVVALVVFGADIMKFLRCRERLRRFAAER